VTPISATWRLALAGLVAVLLVILVINVISQPVAAKQRSYTADFTDIAGLHTGADVRIRGVRVGKVETLNLRRTDGRSLVQAGFTLDSHYGISPNSRLAIKYQALTGLRYVDLVDASEGAAASETMAHVPTSMTRPSFDITRLFNGLQPVLETLSPDDLNTFTANVETFLSGDGTGLAPVLESVRTLTQFMSDRQEVIATLLQNLRALAKDMSGKAKDFIQIIEWVNRPIDGALSVLDEFRKQSIYGPAFSGTVVRLLNNLGIKKGIDIDAAFDKAFTNLDDTITAFKFIPVIWDNIPPPSEDGHPLECSQGRAELPLPVDVLLNGQKVVLCNQ
jgi:phospholipid/cholesterol/gamma-HCH transport system substrate-binding protein